MGFDGIVLGKMGKASKIRYKYVKVNEMKALVMKIKQIMGMSSLQKIKHQQKVIYLQVIVQRTN